MNVILGKEIEEKVKQRREEKENTEIKEDRYVKRVPGEFDVGKKMIKEEDKKKKRRNKRKKMIEGINVEVCC